MVNVTAHTRLEAWQRPIIFRTWDLSRLSLKELASRLIFFAMVVSVLIMSAICVVIAIKWIDKPFAGFLVNERMVLGNIGQYHWTGTQAGLTFPDKIVEANGRAISSMRDLEEVTKTTNVGDPIRYSVQRGGEVIDLAIPTMRFTWADLLMTFGIPFLSGIIYLIIGMTAFILKPDTNVSWAFFLGCFFLSIYAITSFDIQSTHWGFIRVYLFVNTFFPAAFAHLSLIFPEKKKFIERHPHLQLIPYVISAALIMPMEFIYPRPSFMAIYQGVRLYTILAAVIMVVSTLGAYFKRSSVLARQRAKVLLFGAGLAFPIPAFAHYLSLFGGPLLSVTIQNNFLAIPITIFPASIAYAIARHNLFDVDVYIKRAVGYGIMTAVVGIGYFSIQTVTSTVLFSPLFGEYAQNVYPLAFALLVVFFFNPINRKIQDGVDRLFFRRKFDYKETISSVSNALTSVLNLDQIIMQIVHTLRREMFVATAGLVILETEKKTCQAFFMSDDPNGGKDNLKDVSMSYDDPLLDLLSREKNLVTKYDLEEDPHYEEVKETCGERFSEMSASIAIPLLYRGEVMGLLALGDKKSGHFYNREDIDLLSTMANQGAVAIRNAIAHQEVVRYAEELAASLKRIQILESIKSHLVKFVPKTVHDLIEQSPEAPSFDKREADVSVLFADITGYTRLSAQMDFDEVNQLVENYFGAFLDEILKQGGDVNETAGDGLMVIFQDPDPNRHARAATRAALAIQRRAREINARLEGRHEPVAIRVGVNSGIASVGVTRIEGMAGTRWTYTASGTTTNVAARLAALAEGGAVVLNDETRRRLGEEFKVEDLGLQSLKNVEHPVRAYRLAV